MLDRLWDAARVRALEQSPARDRRRPLLARDWATL